jgi:hypothetical protein
VGSNPTPSASILFFPVRTCSRFLISDFQATVHIEEDLASRFGPNEIARISISRLRISSRNSGDHFSDEIIAANS